MMTTSYIKSEGVTVTFSNASTSYQRVYGSGIDYIGRQKRLAKIKRDFNRLRIGALLLWLIVGVIIIVIKRGG